MWLAASPDVGQLMAIDLKKKTMSCCAIRGALEFKSFQIWEHFPNYGDHPPPIQFIYKPELTYFQTDWPKIGQGGKSDFWLIVFTLL